MKVENIYKRLPNFLQNFTVYLYNKKNYKQRHGGNYQKYVDLYNSNRNLSLLELKNVQNERFLAFLNHTLSHSEFYKTLYKGIELPNSVSEISKLPIVDKEMLRENVENVYTVDSNKAVQIKTGGTTGKSLEVFYTLENRQERVAMLDEFRGQHGYTLGKKTAWFSGKNLLTQRDIRKKRFWKTDWFHKVRYYSTFHINHNYLEFYLSDILKYKPEYLVGFPSSILEIAKFGNREGVKFPKGVIKAIFPTSETITSEMRSIIESFFHTKMYNQYASAEGSPFIFECKEGNMHLELQSGVFEVLDENNLSTKSGKLVVTSFTTYGTPLIRYNIGDSITLDDSFHMCKCGNNNPLVKEILGRIDDYIYSPENGKINLGNVSNTLKDTKGIIRFQAIQNELNLIELYVEIDKTSYNDKVERKFLQNWRDRIGFKMGINIKYVDNIPVEKSGKYRIVKNNIKHLLDN